MTDAVLYALQATGQAQTANAFNVVERAIAASDKSLDVYSKRTQKAASLFTALGGAVSGISPQFAALSAGAGRAAPAIEALTGLIGGGPGAAIAGGLIGAIGLGAAAWKLYGDSQDIARTSAANMNVTLEAQLELISKLDRARVQRETVASGVAGPEAQFAEVQRLETERDRIRARMAQLRSDDDKFSLVQGPGRDSESQASRFLRGDFGPAPEGGRQDSVQREFARLAARDQRNAAELEKARSQHKQSLTEEVEIVLDEDEGTDKPDKKSELTENEKHIAALRAMEEKNYAEGSAREQELDRAAAALREIQRKQSLDVEVNQERAAAIERETLRKQSLEQQISDERYAHDEKMRMEEEGYEHAAQLAEERRRVVGTQGKQAYDMVAGAAAGFFAKLATGQKTSTKEFIVGVGAQAVQQGAFNTLQALFHLANPITAAAGAAELPPALAMAALGAALAGGGSSLGGGGGGGGGGAGGGGGGAPMYAPTFVKPSRDSGAQNAQPVVLYTVHATVAPTERDGQQVNRAREEAERHGL